MRFFYFIRSDVMFYFEKQRVYHFWIDKITSASRQGILENIKENVWIML